MEKPSQLRGFYKGENTELADAVCFVMKRVHLEIMALFEKRGGTLFASVGESQIDEVDPGGGPAEYAWVDSGRDEHDGYRGHPTIIILNESTVRDGKQARQMVAKALLHGQHRAMRKFRRPYRAVGDDGLRWHDFEHALWGVLTAQWSGRTKLTPLSRVMELASVAGQLDVHREKAKRDVEERNTRQKFEADQKYPPTIPL